MSSNSELLPDTLAAEVEALRARNAQLEHTLAAARSIIEEYQDHIIKAQKYKPTSDRGGAVSPLLAALERVRGVLREGAG
jgi:cell division septum initiation protein DivIVA